MSRHILTNIQRFVVDIKLIDKCCFGVFNSFHFKRLP